VALAAALFAEDAGAHDEYTDLEWPAREGREYFGGLLDGPASRCFVAEVDGTVCGLLIGRITRDTTVRPTRAAELESMYVRPGYRSAGVGSALMAEFMDWARARGAKLAGVTAFAANDRAIAFYRRHGFAPKSLHLETAL
jgi:ribosomal protein S18 acetylase RimI-like enzyme